VLTDVRRARPGSRGTRGVAVSLSLPPLLLVAALAAGCSDDAAQPDPVAPVSLSAEEQTACEAFLADLPEAAADATLTCGAPEPATLLDTSECDEVLGVGWFIDPDELSDPASSVTATAIGVRPRVAVVFSAEQRGQFSLEVLSALADPVTEHLERVSRCQ
jgi:hypothetical protein